MWTDSNCYLNGSGWSTNYLIRAAWPPFLRLHIFMSNHYMQPLLHMFNLVYGNLLMPSSTQRISSEVARITVPLPFHQPITSTETIIYPVTMVTTWWHSACSRMFHDFVVSPMSRFQDISHITRTQRRAWTKVFVDKLHILALLQRTSEQKFLMVMSQQYFKSPSIWILWGHKEHFANTD